METLVEKTKAEEAALAKQEPEPRPTEADLEEKEASERRLAEELSRLENVLLDERNAVEAQQEKVRKDIAELEAGMEKMRQDEVLAEDRRAFARAGRAKYEK